MSTSIFGARARTAKLVGVIRAVATSSACALLVLGGGTSIAKESGGKVPLSMDASAKQAPRVYRGAEATEAFEAVKIDVDLRTLPVAKWWQPGEAIKEVPKRSKIEPRKLDPDAQAAARARAAKTDPLLSAQDQVKGQESSRVFGSTILNYNGQGFSGVNPPDTVGDVGTQYYIQMINLSGGASYVVYDKTDGSIVAGPTSLETLWPGGGNCAAGLGDPIALHDSLANRWMLSEFSSSGNRMCIYVSQTDNPVTGGWYAYEIAAPSFPDYPKYAVWPDAYYISSNETSSAAYAIDRVAMLNGDPATVQRFTAPDLGAFGFQALQPADVDGPAAPPFGSPGIFMRHNDDEAHNPGSANPAEDYLEIWEFDVDFATPANSTFTGPFQIPISNIDSELCGFFSFSCFDQPGGGSDLDPLREVIMWRLVYRNFGSHETLVGNLVTDVDGTDRGGIRWFELRKTGAGNWTLFQEGTYSPDTDSRFMGSIAMDGASNIAIAYNVSSTTQFPSLRYAGRLAGDAAGTMPNGEHSIVEGTASNGSNRYGDYSSLNLDPVDDCTFWFTGEWNSSSSWSTRIANFRFDACGEPGFTLSANPSNPQVCAPGPVEPITINVGSISEFAGDVTLSVDAPAGITASAITPNPATAPGSASVTLTTTAAASAGNNFVTISGTASGADPRETVVTVGVTTDVPTAPALLAPLDGAADQATSPTLSWSDTGADTYFVEVSDDPGFGTIVDSATVTGTTFNPIGLSTESTYYWRVTGSNICGDGDTSATSSFSTGLTICSTVPLVLPDGDSAGISQDLFVGDAGTILDLDVSILADHTYVGDLLFRLENVDSGISVVLMNRPGEPATFFGCSADDVNATFDDSGDYIVETACVAPGPGPEAIAGRPIPDQALSAFNGLDLAGTWRLFASDNAGADLGQVNEWCLLPVLAGGADSDNDGVPDDSDNCIAVSNSGQYDSNGDNIGNACDGDVAGPGGGPEDCIVNFADLFVLESAFFTSAGDPNFDADVDFNGDNNVNFLDLQRMESFFFLPPGPSANGCN